MPKIDTITTADGSKRYRFTIDVGRDPTTGKRRQRRYTYDRMKTARAELARLTGDVHAGTYTERSAQTLAEALDMYLASATYGLADATKVSYANALLPARERLGRRKLQSLTRQDIEQLRDWLETAGRRRGGTPGTGLGPRSVQLTLGRLKAALEHACQDGRLAANPAAYVRPPRQAKRPRTTWPAGDLRAFLAEAATHRLAACWQLSARGLRRGEVLGLQWGDIDHDAGTVTVGRARVLVAGRVITKDPKSERGRRVLPLDGELAAALRAQHARQAAERLEAGGAWDNPAGWVAVDELGAPLHPEFYGDEFRRLCTAAGVPVIRLHDVRHTMSSLMAAAGVPDHVRAAWAGHTVAVQVGTYTHARPEDLAAAGKALVGVLGGV